MTEPTLVKKYPNRRLYDTSTSTYITLADVKQMILNGESVKVVEAKTEEDLTRQTLMQIILEEEAGGSPVFSATMLESMIKTYGKAQQSALGPFLDASLQQFTRAQELMQKQMAAMAPSRVGAKATAQWTEIMEGQGKIMADIAEKQAQGLKVMMEQMGTLFKPPGSGKS